MSIYSKIAIKVTVDAVSEEEPTYNEDYGTYDPTDATGEEIIELRTAPFGPPKDRDNEPYNPGRHQYSSEKGSSYSTREPRKFFFLDEMTQYNTKDNWQSGPCDNDPARDHVSEHAGYWTSPGGESCDWQNYDGPGDPHKPTTFSMTIVSSKKKNLIYNIGHGDWLSTSEGVDYGVVGISGHIGATFDLNYRDRGSSNAYSSIGIQHIYCMYRADIEEDEIPPLVEEMEEMVKWFGEIDEMMSEIFPTGIPDNLEEQIQAAINANTGQLEDGTSQVNGYSTRTVTSIFNKGRLEKLKEIRFEKNDTTIRILQLFKELMGRSFSGKSTIDKTQYNPDVTSDYIMSLFRAPSEFNFGEDTTDLYSDNTELVTGVELLMWYIYEFFSENENIDSILSILQQTSIGNASNRVARDFLTERVASYWTYDQEEQPNWDEYGVVTFYDGFDRGLKYHIHNANQYRIALWWSNPNEEFSTKQSKYGGFVDPDTTIEVPPLGAFLKIAAVNPEGSTHEWGRMFGRKTKVNINESVASYGTGVPDIGTPGFNNSTFKIYNGLGYYQHADGQKPKWGAVLKGNSTLPGTAKNYYHQTWLDPDVLDNNLMTDTTKGHNTPCTWSLPCRTKYTDLGGFPRDETSKYVFYLPKHSEYKRVALWVCDANLNLNNESTGKNEPYQWFQLRILERGTVYEFAVRNNTDPKGLIDGKAHSFYRIGVLPNKKNGRHHFEDPTVRQVDVPGKLPAVPDRGIETGVSFWPTRNYEDQDPDFSIQHYIQQCNIIDGTVQIIPESFKILEDGRKSVAFQCDAYTSANVLLDEIYLTDDMEPTNVPATPRKPIEEVLTKLPAVNYNDDPGTWRLNGGKTEPKAGERDFYYIKDRGYIIYWNSQTNSWVEKNPSKYRYETLSANKSVPSILDVDKEGDICVMRTPWGKVFSGEGSSDPDLEDQYQAVSNAAGYAYLFLNGKWYSAGNVVAYRNTAAVPSAEHEFEFVQIHDNSNININYDDPDNPGNNLHKNANDPNYMLYVKGDGRNTNNEYSDKNYNFIGFVDLEDPDVYDERNIYMHPGGMAELENPIPGHELVWVEKKYVPAGAGLIGTPSDDDPDYGTFTRGGYMVAYDEITRKWTTWPSTDDKTMEGKLTVGTTNPVGRPIQSGSYYVNTKNETLFVGWRTARNDLVNDGYEYEWQRVPKPVSMINNDTTIMRQRTSDGEFLRVGYRYYGGIHKQIICGNTNTDERRHMHLIAGGDGTVDAVIDEWRYFKSHSAWNAGKDQDVNIDDVYYDYVEQSSPGSRVYRTTFNSTNGKVESVDITFYDTTDLPITQVSNLAPSYNPHKVGDVYKSPANPDNYPIPENSPTTLVYAPSQIMEGRDSGLSPKQYAGIISHSDTTAASYEKFAETNTIIETDYRNIDGNGQTGVPVGVYPGLENDPFLIYKNPDGRGGGPLWKYFSQTSGGTPVGWKIIVGGRVSDGRTDENARVGVGNANGDYDNSGGTGTGGGAGSGGEDTGGSRPDLGYRTKSTGNNNTAPSGDASGSDYYDQDQREYVKRRSEDINRAKRLPNVDSPTTNIGSIYIINKDDYDFTNRRPADGTPGRNSTVPNYDENELYIATYDENRNRVFKLVGTLFDSGDRTGVTNDPPNLPENAVFVKDDKLEIVTDRRGSATYTTLTGDPVEQSTQTDSSVTEDSHPSQPIVAKGSPQAAPGPLPEGSTQTESPPLYTNSSTQYTEAETIRPPGANTATEIKVTDKSAQTARNNNFMWKGETLPDGSASREKGIWIDFSGANFTFGPILPKNETTSKNDGDIHIKAATESSREGTMYVRQGGDMVRGPGGSANEDTIPIVRNGDIDRHRPASAPGDLRVRIQAPDPEDPNDDTENRIVLDVAISVAGDTPEDPDLIDGIGDGGFVDAVDRYGLFIAGEPFDDEDELIEVPNEYDLPNTRYYHGKSSERPDWAIYTELWTWELKDQHYMFFYEYTTRAKEPTLSRDPVDEVDIWSSKVNSADPKDWTKVCSLAPGQSKSHIRSNGPGSTIDSASAFYRVAVKTQKFPNDSLPANEWNTKGYKIPVGVTLDVYDPSIQEWIKSKYNPDRVDIESYIDDKTGQVILMVTDGNGNITYNSTGGWEKQIIKKGPGLPPKENEGLEEIDEDGNPLNSYGAEITVKPQGVSEVKELPKLKNKVGDALFLKDKGTGRGKLYVYDGKEGNNGWALVGTKRCPNTKNPGPGDYPGHPHWYPSPRNKPYVWDGKDYVNPVKYHPKDEDGNDIVPDEPDDSGDNEIEISPGDAVGILTALAEVSAYAAIFAAGVIAAKAVGAIWLKKMETDFLAECTEFEAGHELPIGLGSSDVDTFCKWYDLNYKFINMTIKPELRLVTQLLRCRFNGYMFHLAHVGPGKQDVRQLKVHSVVPTYSWGLLEMENHRVLRVIREYSRNSTRSSTDQHQWGVQVDKSIKLDTRERIINQQGVTIDVFALDDNGNNIYDEESGQLVMTKRPWVHTDAWFKPQTSVCLRTTGQDYVYTKARERYQIGDVGLEWVKAEGTTSGHPEVSGINKHRTGPGLYMMNVFNNIGAGSKYYEHYNTDNSSHAWVWELLAHEPKPWPMSFTNSEMQVGIEFDLGSINVNKDQPRAARDWQINFIHLSFETLNGEMKSIKVMPTGGYTFRNSHAFGKPSTHIMGQLENDTYRRVTCWSSDTIDVNDKFWGFAVNAWIGTEYAGDRWRCYNMKNLKPLLREQQ